MAVHTSSMVMALFFFQKFEIFPKLPLGAYLCNFDREKLKNF